MNSSMNMNNNMNNNINNNINNVDLLQNQQNNSNFYQQSQQQFEPLKNTPNISPPKNSLKENLSSNSNLFNINNIMENQDQLNSNNKINFNF